MDSENEEDRNLTKLIQEMAECKTKFQPNLNARFSTGNGPPQDHLQVPSSGAAAEAMITEFPMTTVPLYHSEADHCMNITAAKIQLKDKENAVDMMRHIIKHQNILIDGEEFSDVRDVTNNIESIFGELDVDTDGVLNKEEFLMMKNSYTILQKNLYESHLKYTVQGFPYLDIELEEQVVNIDVSFTPLILSSLKKNISDVSEEEVGSLQGLLNWKKPNKERHPFGANSFSLFLPPRKNVQPGYTWWIVEPKIDKNSPPLSNQRYYPPQVPENLLVLHALLSLFHPHPFLWTRFQPQGTVAIVRAIEDNFYDIMFRMHAEFQLNEPPLHPFWFTPSQFQGRLIINKDATVVKFFYMGVPDTKLNVDMEWLNGPTEDSMEVDIGFNATNVFNILCYICVFSR
ncbi:selenoprotein N [Caerostris darwini]|uniref:Selenoprotein N n=1 Tax=Caerostris darwini TaxID=1538125 RepID=A0AAV4UI01_9ARAC|nr:selenoprotein N [Caerostris darwini]